ncbi:hypothetical protein A0256_14725 [Mucilaginibacter sp. PAMC 26640]|nr:hypothetical protein A0256_14725 [Mucilaginibacter sp. PAMC 26640]
MKTLQQKTALLAWGLCVASLLSNCKKDNPLSPLTEGKSISAANRLAANLPSVSSQYEVATIYKQTTPARICSDANGTLYFTSSYTHQVFSYTQAGVGKLLVTLPSDNTGLLGEGGLKAGSNGTVYGTLTRANKIYKIDRNKHLSYVPLSLSLNGPTDVAIGPDSSLYIADSQNRRIVKVSPAGIATVLAGQTGVSGTADGPAATARFNRIIAIKFAADGNLYILDNNSSDPYDYNGQKLRRVTVGGTVSTIFKLNEADTYIRDFGPAKRDKNFNETSQENFFIIKVKNPLATTDLYNMVSHISSTGVETALTSYTGGYGILDGPADKAEFTLLSGITVKPYGIFVTDYYGAIRVIKKTL